MKETKKTWEESKKETGTREIIWFRESLLQSVIADLFLFGLLSASMAFNYAYLDNSTVWAVLLFILTLIIVSSRSRKMSKRFTSRKELLKYLKKNL